VQNEIVFFPDLMPWETDDDLKSLSPMEVRDVVLDELTPKEKARLNELCIEEMKQELLKKTTSENELVTTIIMQRSL
jgi:hypothetical protein